MENNFLERLKMYKKSLLSFEYQSFSPMIRTESVEIPEDQLPFYKGKQTKLVQFRLLKPQLFEIGNPYNEYHIGGKTFLNLVAHDFETLDRFGIKYETVYKYKTVKSHLVYIHENCDQLIVTDTRVTGLFKVRLEDSKVILY